MSIYDVTAPRGEVTRKELDNHLAGPVSAGPYEGEILGTCNETTGLMSIPGLALTKAEATAVRARLKIDRSQFILDHQSPEAGRYCIAYKNPLFNSYYKENFKCEDLEAGVDQEKRCSVMKDAIDHIAERNWLERFLHETPAGAAFALTGAGGILAVGIYKFIQGRKNPPNDPSGGGASGGTRRELPPSPPSAAPQSARVMTYAVSAEVMAARTSAWTLFARDAANGAERFSDSMVATAAYDARCVGDVVKQTAVPLLVLGALALGAIKAAETGDISTLQRAWAF